MGEDGVVGEDVSGWERVVRLDGRDRGPGTGDQKPSYQNPFKTDKTDRTDR